MQVKYVNGVSVLGTEFVYIPVFTILCTPSRLVALIERLLSINSQSEQIKSCEDDELMSSAPSTVYGLVTVLPERITHVNQMCRSHKLTSNQHNYTCTQAKLGK